MVTKTLPDLVGIIEISEGCHVERQTVDKWRHMGRLPDADLMLSNRPVWLRSTIVKWCDANGRVWHD